jgi:hypothetical protein
MVHSIQFVVVVVVVVVTVDILFEQEFFQSSLQDR